MSRFAPSTAERNRGLTLVEMLACTVVAAVLGLILGAVIVSATRMSLRARRPVELKKEATVAFRLIEKAVRELTPSQIVVSEDGATMTLADGSEPPRYFQIDGADLLYFDGAQVRTIIDDKVETATFALAPGHRPGQFLVRVNLELAHEGHSVQMESVTKPRNE